MKYENFFTWLFMFLGFLGIVWWADMRAAFQRGCSAACSPSGFITPLIDLQVACFCDEGHGKWRRVEVIVDDGEQR